MPLDLFSAAGTAEWQMRLNASPRFLDAAATWRGTLLLVEQDGNDADARHTYVAVGDGRCLALHPAEADDGARADFILEASPATWRALVSADTTPTMAAMTGKLRLAKGDLFALIPHAKAAAELLAAAAEIPA